MLWTLRVGLGRHHGWGVGGLATFHDPTSIESCIINDVASGITRHPPAVTSAAMRCVAATLLLLGGTCALNMGHCLPWLTMTLALTLASTRNRALDSHA